MIIDPFLEPLYKVIHDKIRTSNVLVKDVLLNGRWNWNAIQNQLQDQTKLRISNMYLIMNKICLFGLLLTLVNLLLLLPEVYVGKRIILILLS